MNYTIFDSIAIVVIIFFAYKGYKKGLITETFKILGVVVGMMLAFRLTTRAAAWVASVYPRAKGADKILGFVLVFLITLIIFMIIAKFVKYFLKEILAEWLDKPGGALFGGIKGLLIITVFLPIFLFLPDSIPLAKNTRENSFIFKHFQGVAPKIYDSVLKILPNSKSFNEILEDSFSGIGGSTDYGKGLFDQETLKQLQNLNKDPLQDQDVQSTLEKYQKQLSGYPKKVGQTDLNQLKNLNKGELHHKAVQSALEKYQKQLNISSKEKK